MIEGYIILKDKSQKLTIRIGTYVFESLEEAEEELTCYENPSECRIIKVKFPDNTIDEDDLEDYLDEDADYPSRETFKALSEQCDAVAIQDNENGDYTRFYILQPSQVKTCK